MPSYSKRSLRRAFAGVLLANLVLISPASARKTPAELTATFKDRDAPTPSGATVDTACPVNFVQILDERRSPELVGVINQRAVLAPKDIQTWLRAILAGFNRRGVKPTFDAGVPARPPIAKFSLQTAWIASTEATYSANVVIRLQVQGVADKSLDQVYRGRVSRTAFWSGGVDTLQSAIDGAFADALDAMAVDMKRICAI